MITKTRGHSATVASAFGALCSILRRRRQRHSSSGIIATSVPPLLLLRRHSSSDVIATLLSTAASVPLLLLLRRHCCYDGVTYRRYCDSNTTASVQPRVVNYGHQQPGPSAVVLPTTTQFSRRAFSLCGPDIWNSLPVNIRPTDSLTAFRLALKTHILALLLFSLLLVYG